MPAAKPPKSAPCHTAVFAAPSRCQSASWSWQPPAPPGWNVLPQGLRTLGVQLFNGNVTLLNELVRTTASPMCHRFFCSDRDKLTMTMALVQPAGDSGVRRLAGEAKWGFQRGGNEGDNYAIRQAGARSGGVIVDVGSNLGDVAIAAATPHPEALVVGVEANPITYFYMRWNLHLNGLAADSVFPRVRSNAARAKQRGAPPPVQRVVALHGAIGTSDMRMYAAPGNTLNAMAVPQRPAAAEAARVQARVAAFLQQWPGAVRTDVAAVNLPRLLMEHGVTQVRLLKVDCEGCEYGVLPEWASSGFLARVRLLSAETHARYATAGTYSAQAMEKLDAALLARGCRRPPRPGKKPWQLEFDFPC